MKIVRDKRLRRWTSTGAAGVAREEWMEEDEGRRRWEGVAHARVG